MTELAVSAIEDRLCKMCSLSEPRGTRGACEVLHLESYTENPFLSEHCIHFSCPRGLKAAKTALMKAATLEQEPIIVNLVDGTRVEGFIFGTTYKPPSIRRLVTPASQIITHSLANDTYYLSPQRVDVYSDENF